MASFAKQINDFTKKAGKSFDAHYRISLIQLYVNIVDGTPRDTGTLKNNWWFAKEVGSKSNPKAEYPIGSESAMVFTAIKEAEKVGIRDTCLLYTSPSPRDS